MNPETMYKISTVVLWSMVAFNSWGVWRNLRLSKKLREATAAANIAYAHWQELSDGYQANVVFFEELRGRLLEHDRTEDGAQE